MDPWISKSMKILTRHTYLFIISGDASLQVIDVKDIKSVVVMIPDHSYGLLHQDGTEGDYWFLMEKPVIMMFFNDWCG